MTEIPLEKWIEREAEKQSCHLVGFAEINPEIQEAFSKGIEIDGVPAISVVIIAMALEDPIQDAWTYSPLWPDGKNYMDEALAKVATSLALKLTRRGYPSRPLRYSGTLLKHLAVHAGLGIIGRNNLLVTPEYGPHVRLRGVLSRAPLLPAKSLIGIFNPCDACPEPPPCLKACPCDAFKDPYEVNKNSPKNPGNRQPRSGYWKETCRNYSLDNLRAIGRYTYLWCRACEEACPVGSERLSKKD
jgi:epoxyqueuosine reductase